MAILTFKGLCEVPRGTLSSLLADSSAQWASADPELFEVWERSWRQYDEDVHAHPDTVGRSGFVSCFGETAIGFGSWDPRPFPTARIGHNCILPAFRGAGHGTAQLRRILTVLRDAGFRTVIARTGDVAPFAPARRMYERCGFVATGRHPPAPAAPFSVTEYRLGW